MSHEIVMERIYTIPFFPKLNSCPRTKRAPRAMRLLREFIIRHMKSEDILIDLEVNEFIWSRGIKKPPRKITVRAVKSDDDVIEVYLIGVEQDDVFKPEHIDLPSQPSESDLESEEDFEEEED